MKEKTWQRARSDEQVRQRIREILCAAENLFKQEPFEKVTMQKIARRVGCAQSNIYRYFQNREDIFLTLYIKYAEKWLEDLEREYRSELSVEVFALKWTEILLNHPGLLELQPLLNLILESNSSEQVYYNTKKRFKEKYPQAIASVLKALPSLSEEEALGFLYAQQAFVAGIFPMTQFSDMQKRVLAELEMHQVLLDFSSFCEKTLCHYLKGLLRK